MKLGLLTQLNPLIKIMEEKSMVTWAPTPTPFCQRPAKPKPSWIILINKSIKSVTINQSMKLKMKFEVDNEMEVENEVEVAN